MLDWSKLPTPCYKASLWQTLRYSSLLNVLVILWISCYNEIDSTFSYSILVLPVLQPFGQAELSCANMQDLHTGANNEQPAQKCSVWLEVFPELKRTTNRGVDSAEAAGMTATIADTLPATVVEQHWTIVALQGGVWPNSCLQSVTSVGPPIIMTPPHCAEDSPQTCGTLLIQKLCHTCCKQDPRHGIYSKLVTSIWSQQPWQHLYQSWRGTILRSAEKYPRGRNWMQRHRGDYSNEQTGNEARGSLPKLC